MLRDRRLFARSLFLSADGFVSRFLIEEGTVFRLPE
jgi:hypothetical protein